MAMSHKKLAQKRAKKKLARKAKAQSPVKLVQKKAPQVEEQPQTFRRDPLAGDTTISL
tara:strand:+ start:319 stop:492 length:174 start_codon:yes stop_codon:yes gene_type:complete